MRSRASCPSETLIPVSARTHDWARLDGVDILRGVAILLVLMNHVNMRLFLADIPYLQGVPAPLASSLVWNGQRGVQIFFAVSGFLITSTSLCRWGALSRVDVWRFYGLRFARIAPLLILILVLLSVLHVAGLEDYVISPHAGGLGRALAAALTFHVNLLEARRGYLPGSWDILWSLSVEEMFYLFFPIVCRLLGRGTWLVAGLMVLVVLGPLARTVFAHGNEVWQEYSYLGGMDAIALGCLTALAISRSRMPRSIIGILSGIGAVLMLFSLALPNLAEAWGLQRSGFDMSVLAVGTCMVIAAAAQSRCSKQMGKPACTVSGHTSGSVQL
jgi:peptidoglycan/LPS O-acetylase OafA/YrhL